jgi:RNA polymerase sigma-70 factor (ECF subfamily)
MSLTQRDLVERSAAGDEAAFDQLVRQGIDRMYAIAYRVLGNGETSRDAVQSALWQVWRDLPALRDPDRYDAWARRLLVRSCYEEARRQRRGPVVVEIDPDGLSIPDDTRWVSERDALDRAFRHLSPEHRLVIVLHHYEGLSLVEVADSLGIPVGTARSRLHYGLARLRDVLARDDVLPVPRERPA